MSKMFFLCELSGLSGDNLPEGVGHAEDDWVEVHR